MESIRADRGLFPVANLIKTEAQRDELEAATELAFLGKLKNVGLDMDNTARDLAIGISNAMAKQGVERDVWSGMNIEFLKNLKDGGFAFGYDSGLGGMEPDPQTIECFTKIIEAVAKDKSGEFSMGGDWDVVAKQQDNEFVIEAYQSRYMGRDADGEKSYDLSKSVVVAKIPYDEIAQRNKRAGSAFDTAEVFKSPSFLKANGMAKYLEGVLMNARI